jgi:hypothetical protein
MMSVIDCDWGFGAELSICLEILIMICLDAMLRDPYESKIVEINNSGIDGANEGLFAKKSIEVNTTVAFYNGALVRSDADVDDDDQDSSETNNYKIFDPADMPDGTIDIPLWAQVRQIIICKHNVDFYYFSPYMITVQH